MSRRAFSLVEMVVALVIFSLGVLATLEIFSLSVVSAGTSANYNRAVFLAQGLMEETLAEEDWTAETDGGEFGEQLPDGSWTRRILETDRIGLYEIEITVAWSERGTVNEFSLTTLAAER